MIQQKLYATRFKTICTNHYEKRNDELKMKIMAELERCSVMNFYINIIAFVAIEIVINKA